MHETKVIKNRIKGKFSTIRRFASLAEIPEKDIRNYLSGKISMSKMEEYGKFLLSKIDSTRNIPDPNLTTKKDREFIRTGIVIRFKSIRNFCRQYPDFTPVIISNIITGRRRKIDKKVNELFEILES